MFVINIDSCLVIVGVCNNVFYEVIVVMIEVVKFFDNVGVYIVVLFFDFLCCFEWWVGFVVVF